MMADVVLGAKFNSDEQPQFLSEDINMNCGSCVSVKEQLHSALLELNEHDQFLHFFKKPLTLKDEGQTVLFKDPVHTAL
jgi:hypothetical protein